MNAQIVTAEINVFFLKIELCIHLGAESKSNVFSERIKDERRQIIDNHIFVHLSR